MLGGVSASMPSLVSCGERAVVFPSLASLLSPCTLYCLQCVCVCEGEIESVCVCVCVCVCALFCLLTAQLSGHLCLMQHFKIISLTGFLPSVFLTQTHTHTHTHTHTLTHTALPE